MLAEVPQFILSMRTEGLFEGQSGCNAWDDMHESRGHDSVSLGTHGDRGNIKEMQVERMTPYQIKFGSYYRPRVFDSSVVPSRHMSRREEVSTRR
jgi:hypothetical protein